jgi:type I restriction enzyme S subunit
MRDNEGKSRWKRYPKYKDSGVEWLGEIPEGWILKRTKNIANIIPGQSPEESSYNLDQIGAILINGPAEYSETDFGLTRSIKWTVLT